MVVGAANLVALIDLQYMFMSVTILVLDSVFVLQLYMMRSVLAAGLTVCLCTSLPLPWQQCSHLRSPVTL
jgi:hypothetical protein